MIDTIESIGYTHIRVEASELPEGGYQVLVQQEDKIWHGLKEMALTPLLSSIGGLVALSFLILQDLISLDRVDLTMVISLITFASAVPLLAASVWLVKIWHAAPMKPRRVKEVTRKNGTKFVCIEVGPTPGYLGSLWIVLLAASMSLVGTAAALWHVFWVASVVFTLAVILGFVVVGLAWNNRPIPRPTPKKGGGGTMYMG